MPPGGECEMAYGTDKDPLFSGFQVSDFHVDMMYKRYFNGSGDMRFISSGRGKLLDVNQAGVELFGYGSKEELLGLDNVCLLFSNPEDGRQFQQRLAENGFLREYEAELKKKDGSVFSGSITATLWFEADGSISWEGELRDISGLKELQEAYLEAESDHAAFTTVFYGVSEKVSEHGFQPYHIGADWNSSGWNRSETVVDHYLLFFNFI